MGACNDSCRLYRNRRSDHLDAVVCALRLHRQAYRARRIAVNIKLLTPLLCPDDHCPVSSVGILRVRNANPLRAVRQQIGAMSR